MTLETEDLLQSILDSLDRIDYIRPDDIPDIELYMDQVTTFMDSRLKNAARNPEVDKILTKTMINNYAKNDLLPPPVRKKYSREHMLLLIFIYYFKGILSISDIQTVLKPITDRFFAGNEGLKLANLLRRLRTAFPSSSQLSTTAQICQSRRYRELSVYCPGCPKKKPVE